MLQKVDARTNHIHQLWHNRARIPRHFATSVTVVGIKNPYDDESGASIDSIYIIHHRKSTTFLNSQKAEPLPEAVGQRIAIRRCCISPRR